MAAGSVSFFAKMMGTITNAFFVHCFGLRSLIKFADFVWTATLILTLDNGRHCVPQAPLPCLEG